MNTSLIGRKVKNYHNDKPGTIVAVYIVHDEPVLVIENPEGGLFTMNAAVANLESDPWAAQVIGTDLHAYKAPDANPGDTT